MVGARVRSALRWGCAGLSLAAFCVAAGANADESWWKQGADLLGRASSGSSGEENADVTAGLKEALRVGTENVVAQLGKPGGFSEDPAVHIPLPGSLDTVRQGLGTIGMSSLLDDLEMKLNEAAETATPKARALFVDAISAMTLDDAMGIFNGPPDSATRYFQGKMSSPLTEEMTPVVETSLSEVGAVKQYDAVMKQYESIPFMPDAKADLTGYVVDKGLDGIFHYLAEQEAAIRSDPAARSTELLQSVFGD